jgi:ATP-dependent protease ClpP protease subunit
MAKKSSTLELSIYGVVDPLWGDVSAAAIRDELKAAGDVKTIHVRINSPGGAVFEGSAVYSLLKSHAARKIVTVDGLAASTASLIAMAGDEIVVSEAGYIMIHDPIGSVWAGDAEELRGMADLLDKLKLQITGIYARRTGRSEADIAAMMAAETWLTAEEAVKEKFADRVAPGLAVAAAFDPTKYQFHNIPESLKGPKMSTSQPATFAELKTTFPQADATFIVAQQEASATLDQARNAYQAMLEKKLQAAEARAGKSTSALGVSVAPEGRVLGSGVSTGDPIGKWEAALAQLTATGLPSRVAISRLVAERPELHAAYLEAYNLEHADARR